MALSPDGRLAAAVDQESWTAGVIRVWELTTHQEIAAMDVGWVVRRVRITDDGRVLSSGPTGLLSWDLTTGTSDTLVEGSVGSFASTRRTPGSCSSGREGDSPGGPGRAVLLDLETGSELPLSSHGHRVTTSPSIQRARWSSPEMPTAPSELAPITVTRSRTFCSATEARSWTSPSIPSDAGSLRPRDPTTAAIWPMPDLSKPPLHTLLREELIAKLKTLTNLRVVRDEESATGWELDPRPLPGWETVPTWWSPPTRPAMGLWGCGAMGLWPPPTQDTRCKSTRSRPSFRAYGSGEASCARAAYHSHLSS